MSRPVVEMLSFMMTYALGMCYYNLCYRSVLVRCFPCKVELDPVLRTVSSRISADTKAVYVEDRGHI